MKADYQILVVDDDESIRRMLALVLTREGFQTITAKDGQEGLALFRSHSPDIVLMDIRMPGLSGIEAMSAMLALRPGAAVILMTAYADLETAVQAIKNGVFDFVIKPFDLAEIGLLVNRAWQMREMKREIGLLQVLARMLGAGMVCRVPLHRCRPMVCSPHHAASSHYRAGREAASARK